MIELWPTKIMFQSLAAKAYCSQLNRELISDIQQIRRLDGEGRAWSKANYPGGYTSYSSIANVHRRFAPFMELKTKIDRHVKKFALEQNWDLGHASLEMTTCWVNVMGPHCHHSLHLHPLAVVSGTYYVQVPHGSGAFKLEDPRLGLLMAAPARRSKAPKSEQPFFNIEPKAGHLVLFESWLRHEVTANRGKGTRVSVSFNYEWV